MSISCYQIGTLNTPLEPPGASGTEFGIPAQRCLGDLAGMTPVLRADSREIQPLKFNHLHCIYGQTLPEGDYQIAGISDWAVERKGSLNELAACCMGKNRERQEREFKRLLPYSFRRLLIVGAACDEDILLYRYYSNISPKSVLGTLYAWQASFNLPFVLAPTPEKAALLIERWAKCWCAHKAKDLNELLRGCRESQVDQSNPFT